MSVRKWFESIEKIYFWGGGFWEKISEEDVSEEDVSEGENFWGRTFLREDIPEGGHFWGGIFLREDISEEYVFLIKVAICMEILIGEKIILQLAFMA